MTDQTNSLPERFEAFLTVEDVAAMLRMPVASLRYWRVLGAGPRGFLVGRRLRYELPDVLAWIEEQRDRDPRASLGVGQGSGSDHPVGQGLHLHRVGHLGSGHRKDLHGRIRGGDPDHENLGIGGHRAAGHRGRCREQQRDDRSA